MRNTGSRSRFLRLSPLALGAVLVLVGVMAIALAGWAYSGSAAAHPGMSCNPDPGHHGCHEEATPTTEKPKPTTTTAKPKPTTTTAKPKPSTTTTKPKTTTTKASTGTTGANTGTTKATSTTTAVTAAGAATSTTLETTTTLKETTTTATTESITETTAETQTLAGSTVTTSPPTALLAPSGYLDQNNCLECHGDPSITQNGGNGASYSLYVNAANLPQAVHRYQDCTECHGSNPHETQTRLTKMSQAEMCGSCHRYQYSQYLTSIHGEGVSVNAPAATCSDCHSADSNPHHVVRVLEPNASTYPKNIAETCAKCHNNPQLMAKYGIVEKVYDSYMRSYHGKAMNLASDKAAIEQLNIATCVSCHGSHAIKAVNDPTSSVAGMDNLLKTCTGCHPGAGPQFVAGFLGHKAADPTYVPEAYWGGKSFFVFSRAMLAGGVLIVASSIGLRGVPRVLRKVKARRQKED